MEDGFYWAKYKNDGAARNGFVVEVAGDNVAVTWSERAYDLDYFEEVAEFLSKEPLTPPEAQ